MSAIASHTCLARPRRLCPPLKLAKGAVGVAAPPLLFAAFQHRDEAHALELANDSKYGPGRAFSTSDDCSKNTILAICVLSGSLT